MFLSKSHTIKFRKSLRERSNCYIHLGDRCNIAHFELRWTQGSQSTTRRPSNSQSTTMSLATPSAVLGLTPKSTSTVSRITPLSTARVSLGAHQSNSTVSPLTQQNTSTLSRVTTHNAVVSHTQPQVLPQSLNRDGLRPRVESYPGTTIIEIYHAGYVDEIRQLKER